MGNSIRKRLADVRVPLLLVMVSLAVAFGFIGVLTWNDVLADTPDAQCVLGLGDNEVTISGSDETICSFTPENDALYQFCSITDSVDPYATLYDAEDQYLEYNDDYHWYDSDFVIIYRLEAGKTYYLKCALFRHPDVETTINVNVSIVPEYELQVGVDNEVDLRTDRQYEECYFTPKETSFYEFNISAGNAEPSWYFNDANGNSVPLPTQTRSSFICKLNAGERYNLRIESGYASSGIIATVTINTYTPVTSGTCGDSVTWSYDISTGELTISGTGKMYEFSSYGDETNPPAPWLILRNDMKSVVIGDGITSVGSNAFYSCKALETATIGKDVEVLGYYSFQLCEGLTSVTFSPDSVLTDIGTYAFGACTNLESISIPKTVTKMNNSVFGSCAKLKDIVLPEGLKELGTGVFEGCESLTSMVIPSGITSIGSSMFYYCKNLTEVTIPDTVTSIDVSVFYYCSALESISIPEGVTSIGDSAFEYCQSLKSIEIPDSVRYIGSRAFGSCDALESVKIPEGVEYIQDFTFAYCKKLTDVSLPSTLKSIGSDAFFLCETLPEIVLPDSLEVIGNEAFYNCDLLAHVTFGKNTKTIGGSAFAYCEALKEITLPERVETIGDCAFQNCTELQKATVNSGSLGESTFSNAYVFDRCGKLETVILGPKVSFIGNYSFSECTSLTSISIPGKVGIIGEGAFYDCTSLGNVVIEEGVNTIGTKAFLFCSGITEITIPASVIKIEDAAFNSCTGITDIYCYANPEKLSWTGANNDFKPWSSGGNVVKTKCHVFEEYLDEYEAKFGSGQSNMNKKVNVTFEGDLSGSVNMSLGEHLYGCTLSLAGDIGVNFYMDLSSADLSEDAYVEFAVPSGDKTVVKKVYVQAKAGEDRTVAETVPVGEKTYYVFNCQVSAKEVSSPIQAQMIDGDRSGQKYTYSVKSYADYLLAHTEDNVEYAKAAPLVKALVSYCSWTQFYFLGNYYYHIDDSYLDENAIDAVTGSELEEAAPEVVIDLDALPGVTFEGATLSLKSETTLSLYFSSDEKLTFSCNGGKVIETARVNGYQVVRIRGIAAADIGDAFTVSVSCGGKTGTVRYSVLNYISNVVNENYENELQCVVKALYLYYQAAEAYSA